LTGDGRASVPAFTVVEQMAAIIPMKHPRSVGYAAGLDRADRRCLAKDPADRYQSTKDLYLDLRTLRDHGMSLSRFAKAGSRGRRPAGSVGGVGISCW